MTNQNPQNQSSLSKKRRSRLKREPRKREINIQGRDIDILRALYTCRLLTTDQVANLFFSSRKRAEQRLRVLFDFELIDRIHRKYIVGSAEELHILGTKGVQLLAQETELDYKEVNRARLSARKISPFFLDHYILVNDFRIAVDRASREQGYQMLFWKEEKDFRKRKLGGGFIDKVRDPKTGRTIPITPDGFFGIETPRGKSYFFVEVDRGKANNSPFTEKMHGYALYYQGAYQQRWGYKHFRVLVATANPARRLKALQNLKEKHLLPIFFITDLGNITPEKVFTAVWQSADAQTFKSLF